MSIKKGILFLVLALLVALGGWYIYDHSQSLPHTLDERGDRQVKINGDYYTVQAVYPNTTRLGTRTDAAAGADERAERVLESWVNQTVSGFESDADKALTAEEKARLTDEKAKYALSIAYHPYNSGSFVSEEFDLYQDTGGAHPISFYKTFVFDLKGNEVKLSDLFASGDYLARIAAEAKKQVGDQLALRGGADATSSLVEAGVAANADNFSNWVDDEGILTIFIPPYQAAAYAAGSFEVRIPLTELKDILKPGIQ